MYDVLIIGAGMSGLTAGIRLAYYDKKVRILEQHNRIGGLNSYYERGDFELDVGLHALTNFVPSNERLAPLNKMLRQLRLRYDDLELYPQKHSLVIFPDTKLEFSNDFALLEENIFDTFPSQIDNFRHLVKYIFEYDALSFDVEVLPAREIISSFLTDPLLIDMLLCPLMYYGNAEEKTMDFNQFCIMFRAIFIEGFAKPQKGIRKICKLLLDKYLTNNGELSFNSKVEQIIIKNNKAIGIRLKSGEELYAKHILSSAGLVETMRLCSTKLAKEYEKHIGKMSFIEVILALKEPLKDYDYTILFFNKNKEFHFESAHKPINLTSGIICATDNFQYPQLSDTHFLRLSAIANYDYWANLEKTEYKKQKAIWQEKFIDAAMPYLPNYFREIRSNKEEIIFDDMFTPKTIEHFTGHINGAIYGSPNKHRDGRTDINNLFLIGTDQGFLGIIGAMISGISIANAYCLRG